MCASLSGVPCLEARAEESKHVCVQVSQDSDPQVSVRVDVPTAPTFCVMRTKESNTCVQVFFTRMPGSVLDRQPTVFLRVSAMKR